LEDRPIFVFDEWAADQDPIFKEVFYRKILPDLKAQGKAVLVITHDDRYFSEADRVIALCDGEMVHDDWELAQTLAEVGQATHRSSRSADPTSTK
jgi:putative ATP-binding cassette transporter